MSDQISLFDLMSETPVVSEPTPEVVIALETAKEVVYSLAEKAGMRPEQVNDRIVVVGIPPYQEEQPAVSVDTISADPEGVIAPVISPETTLAEISQELGAPENTVAELVGLQQEEQTALSADTISPEPEPVIALVLSPERQLELIFNEHWVNSMDLAYSMINIALPEEDYLFDDFTTYIKACRYAENGDREKPKANERFDRLAWCLRQMPFSKIERGGKGKVNRIETNVLELAIDLSFDEAEVRELREFGVRGTSGERITKLAWAINTYVEQKTDEVIIPASAPEAGEIIQNVQHLLDEIKQSTYAILFDRLGVPKEKFPDFSSMDSILTALLDAIGTDERKLDMVLSYSDITEKQLFKAAEKDIETKKRLREIARTQLKRDLNGFYCTGEWHHHRCFARYPVYLTDGALYLAEHGGADATTAFWLMDVIASYQGEKQMKRIENPQLWKIECFEKDGKRSCVVSCGNNPNKPLIKQDIPSTNFLLNEYTLYASLEPFEEGGRLALIISLIAER